MHLSPVKVISAALAGVFALTGVVASPPSQALTGKAKPSLVAKGKSLSTKYGCNTCHGKDLAGKPKFSPSLKSTGVLKEYNPKTWATVLNTGVTNDGGKVKDPMPVYKMKATESAALWAYFKTLK